MIPDPLTAIRHLSAQLENTLVMSVTETLSGERSLTSASISNFAAFIQASVLFDDIYLTTGRKVREVSPLTLLPDKLRTAGWYHYHILDDASVRHEHAIATLIDICSSRSTNTDLMGKGKSLIAKLRRSIAETGPAWSGLFWNDIERVISGKTAYAQEGVPKAIDSFSGEDYADLTNHEKLALYYWLKSLFNVRLAVDCERVLFSNFARNPLVPNVYDLLYQQYVRTPLIEKFITSGRGNWVATLKKEFQSAKWDIVLTTLVAEVLERAKFEKNRVAEAIVDLRDSTAARRFRKHYRNILSSEPYRNPWEEVSRDVDQMIKHWNEISRRGTSRVRVWAPFVRGYLSISKILEGYDEIITFLKHFRHLNLFWQHGADVITLDRDAAAAIYKTFGTIEEEVDHRHIASD